MVAAVLVVNRKPSEPMKQVIATEFEIESYFKQNRLGIQLCCSAGFEGQDRVFLLAEGEEMPVFCVKPESAKKAFSAATIWGYYLKTHGDTHVNGVKL